MVSSQNRYSMSVLSVLTRPSMAPANATNTPANRALPLAAAAKYQAQ